MVLANAAVRATAGKPDMDGATKKSPVGFMHVGDLAFDLQLPESNVSKNDMPSMLKHSDAVRLQEGPTAKPHSLLSLPQV